VAVIVRQDAIRVVGAITGDVVHGLIERIHYASGQRHGQELLAIIFWRCRQHFLRNQPHSAAQGGKGRLIGAHLDASGIQRSDHGRQKGRGHVAVHEERVQRVADRRGLDLGVQDDGDSAFQICGHVDIQVAHTDAPVEHRHSGVLPDQGLQGRPATRDDQVDHVVHGKECRHHGPVR